MPAKTRFSVALDDDEYETLAVVAEKYRISMAWLVRQAVADFLERYQHNETQLPLPLAASRPERRGT